MKRRKRKPKTKKSTSAETKLKRETDEETNRSNDSILVGLNEELNRHEGLADSWVAQLYGSEDDPAMRSVNAHRWLDDK